MPARYALSGRTWKWAHHSGRGGAMRYSAPEQRHDRFAERLRRAKDGVHQCRPDARRLAVGVYRQRSKGQHRRRNLISPHDRGQHSRQAASVTRMQYSRGRQDGQPSRQGTGTFSGRVMLDPLLATTEGGREARVNSVVFEPGGRTYWHSHADGQLLLVASGRGAIETRDGGRHELQPGDSVWAPPGEEHWHGAAPDSFLVHTAVSLGPTHWHEEVSGERYEAAFKQL
jgi:quercetin dioxygenase-like cupin family protein